MSEKATPKLIEVRAAYMGLTGLVNSSVNRGNGLLLIHVGLSKWLLWFRKCGEFGMRR